MFDFLHNRRRKAIIEVLQRQTDHVPARETYPIDYEAARKGALDLWQKSYRWENKVGPFDSSL